MAPGALPRALTDEDGCVFAGTHGPGRAAHRMATARSCSRRRAPAGLRRRRERSLAEALRARRAGRSSTPEARALGPGWSSRAALPEAGWPGAGRRRAPRRCARGGGATPSCARWTGRELLGDARARRPRALLARELPERVTLPGGRGCRSTTSPAAALDRVPPPGLLRPARGPRCGRPRAARAAPARAQPARGPGHPGPRRLLGAALPRARRELGRRYPRHAWPEDPLHASPPAPRGDESIPEMHACGTGDRGAGCYVGHGRATTR